MEVFEEDTAVSEGNKSNDHLVRTNLGKTCLCATALQTPTLLCKGRRRHGLGATVYALYIMPLFKA